MKDKGIKRREEEREEIGKRKETRGERGGEKREKRWIREERIER